MASSIYRERTWTRLLVVSLVALVAGLSLIGWSESGWMKDWPWLKPIVSNVGGLMIASVGLAIVWDFLMRRAFVEEIFETAKIAANIKDARILEVATEFMTGIQWTFT